MILCFIWILNIKISLINNIFIIIIFIFVRLIDGPVFFDSEPLVLSILNGRPKMWGQFDCPLLLSCIIVAVNLFLNKVFIRFLWIFYRIGYICIMKIFYEWYIFYARVCCYLIIIILNFLIIFIRITHWNFITCNRVNFMTIASHLFSCYKFICYLVTVIKIMKY